ncbi:DEAD/DEAH box helicase family protein [Trichomonas vaginalis G3]|uniref:DEAD/DEAH box helicase family protein n=1 Tax=Trichomonas vaginalis (strain ATCC PRA-98 / G3) TaxID=412133 RepID=A2FMN7_TRIV3|nr:ATP-dependent RNA and DNA helicase family [Trichomonas vaginalis G3]EAX93837.1 DEAD/DEAH box helicase family protein [Trichomonas vaginalis G3]KAI5490919.1 ATP-dependent RNA and DNA helicase family [Trichomonas vaginalis G3]|eukprot:XP_001306767.1 DEAD/DEAH box helicase family protein [Trichomonas vaginalis G3]
MDSSLDFLLNDVKIPKFDDSYDLLNPPFQAGPLNYVNFGSQLPKIQDYEPDVLRFEITPPTMMMEPVRDVITGEIESYHDTPIASVAADDSSINRPISSIDDYHRGAATGVAFTPGGFAQKAIADPAELPQFLLALETGTNLLSTPLSEETLQAQDGSLPDLPDLPTINPTAAPQASKQQITDQIKSYAIKDDWDHKKFATEVPNPSLTFPFPLDPFQIRSMYRLEQGQTVFVAAPTSAGKTTVAQYAIALARSHKMKTLYTSPIKALSNQKFRDLQKQFDDVGILTGDVSINRDASCLIMTTEILRSMLYHGADILRDVECVIFDECHYISNDERGVVWEESIILLPFHINMVFLSATVPNAMEIADWIGRTKQRMVYVEEQRFRPVPLEHLLYTGGYELYPVSKPGCGVDQLEYLYACNSLTHEENPFGQYNPFFWNDFIETIKKANLMPILIFCFKQKMCEDLADIVKHECFLTKQEQYHVKGFCRRALSRLNKEDRDLPQIQKTFELLENGIGIHHGGILPILKEIVEILLADGYIKILFCTSTFAMGINVPARSCAFVSLEKYNGKEVASLTSTEYVQMSGRAGRRGLDSVGTSVILCFDQVPDFQYLTSLFQGKTEALQSQFKLKFNTILNLLRVRDIQMVDLLRRSLSANLIQSMMPQLVQQLNDTKQELSNLPPIECMIQDIEDMTNFGYNIDEMKNINQWLLDQVDNRSILKQMTKGRVVFLLNEKPQLVCVREVINDEKIAGIDKTGERIIFSTNEIGAIFAKPTKSQERKNEEDIKRMLINFNEPPLIWTKVIATSDFDFAQASNELIKYYDAVRSSPCANCSLLKSHLCTYNKQQELLDRKEELEHQMHDESLAFKPLLDAHIDVLRELEYINNENILLLKGRVSIEITTVHEILATEILFSGVFENLPPEECAALCSCLCCEGVYSYEEQRILPPNIPDALDTCYNIADDLQKKQAMFGVLDFQDDFSEKNVNPVLCHVVYEWALGSSFSQITDYTDVAEGIIVRTINRVNECLRDFSNAAKLMGHMALSEKFSLATELVKRDIIFASSLYFE